MKRVRDIRGDIPCIIADITMRGGGDKGGGGDQTQVKRHRMKQAMQERLGEGHLNLLNRHPRDDRIRFVEDGHYYHDEDYKRFRFSVTGFIGLFTFPFDMVAALDSKFQNPVWDYTKKEVVVGKSDKAQQLPKDFGLTRMEVVQKMRGKASFGTQMHKKIENYILLQGKHSDKSDEVKLVHLLGLHYTDEELICARQMLQAEKEYHSQKWKPEKAEYSIFCDNLPLAGQVDLLLSRINPATGVKEYMILDWKTTSVDNVRAIFDYKNKSLPYPLQHLPNAFLTSYCLQESVYAYILSTFYGMNVVEIRSVVLNPFKKSPTVISKPPLYDEVNRMISIFKAYLQVENDVLRWCMGEYSPPYLPRLPASLYYTK